MANQLKEELILNSSQFDKNINNVIRKVEELKNKGSKVGGGFETSMGKMIQKATGFNGSMGSLIGVVGKFSGVLGGAISTGEAFNKTIHSSQLLEDEFGKHQEVVTNTVDNFFRAIASGDFSAFNNGIDSMVQKAREAYEALDQLWNMAQSFSVRNARLNNQFNQNLIYIRQNKGSKDKDTQAEVKKRIEENKKIIADQANNGQKLYNQTMLSLRSQIAANGNVAADAITDAMIIEITEADITRNGNDYRKKVDAQYKKYEEENKKLQKKWAAKATTSKGGIDKNRKEWEFGQLARQYAKVIAQQTLLTKYSDEELEKFNQRLIQGYNYQGQSIANQSKLIRYTKENETTTTPKKTTTKKGGGGRSEIEYTVNSVGWLEKQIAELKKEIKLQVDYTEIEKLNEQIKALQLQLDALQRPYKPIKLALEGATPSLMSSVPTSNEQIAKGKTPEAKVKTLEDQYKRLSDIASNVLSGLDMGTIGTDKAKELIDAINAQLQALGLKPLEINIKTDAQKKLDDIASQVGQLGNSFRSLGDGLQMPVLDVAGIIAQAIANIISGYAAASAQAASLGPFGWLGFTLAGLGEIAAVIMQIHSLSAFANGGVVGGSSFAGDNLLVRANSGEMILNTMQQKNLFDMLDKGTTSVSNSNVHFVIRGKDLVGVFDNYNDKIRKIR